MKIMKVAAASASLILAAVLQCSGQNATQPLSFTLTAFDQPTPTTIRQVRFTTKDIIRYFIGTNVNGGQLLLVTPISSGAETNTGNMNSFLRITKGNQTLMEVPSPDSFNFFQDAVSVQSSRNKLSAVAINRFSIDFEEFHAELQGFTSWNGGTSTLVGNFAPFSPFMPVNAASPANSLGIAAFSSTLNGEGTIDGVTQHGVPMQGSVTAGSPKVVAN